MIKEYIWGTEDWIYQDKDVLIKVIDAKTPLSVQVHPGDSYARLHENGSNGKNEMWYVLEAVPGAFVYAGINKNYGLQDDAKSDRRSGTGHITAAEIKSAAEDGTLEKYLERYTVKPGDVINIPAGTIHAIGGGCRILEVQQNSTITYRLYDYGRIGSDGRPRQLHIEKALDVANLNYSENLTSLPLATKDFTVSKDKGKIKVSWLSTSGGEKSFEYSITNTMQK